MVWVLIFGGIALAGLVLLICYGVWLAHKASDVMSEVAVLGDQAGRLIDLLAQIQPPEAELVPRHRYSELTVEGEVVRQYPT
jgi:hypothetical protein